MNRRRRFKAKRRRALLRVHLRMLGSRAAYNRRGYQTYSPDEIREMMARLLPKRTSLGAAIVDRREEVR